MAVSNRALHFVFKIGNRKETMKFYRDVLGMKVLRHEEFEEGCKASCNGPYDGKWSKSMIGYGPEDNSFVMELTYNYGLGSYTLGNDFQSITIHSTKILENAKNVGCNITQNGDVSIISAPDGYKFSIHNKDTVGDPVKKIALASSSLIRSKEFWHDKLGMKIYSETNDSILLGYEDNQCKLELIKIAEPIEHATAFGRIAFSCPESELPIIEKTMKNAGEKILTPLVSLDTPGKATVQVVILADPDGHEICLVGDKAFRELSQLDPKADALLEEGILADTSDEWYAKKNRPKPTAK